jgi:hypothetical protein
LSSNTLYGTAYQGGSVGWGNGTVFALNTDGTGFTNVYSFTGGNDGGNPIGGLILSSNTLYGTTRFGGIWGNGAAFSLPLPPLPPLVLCKHVTVSAGANCSADASVDDGSFDPNAGGTITLTQSPPGPYPLGDTSVTLIATDNRGPTNSCVAIVSVVDMTPPSITPPQNMAVDATSPSGAVVTFPPATAADNCSLASVTSSPASGSTFAIGDTTVLCEATDTAGNQAGCSFTVHVKGAVEQINDLAGVVRSLHLHPGIERSLIAKLQEASSAAERGNHQACASVHAFFNELNAQTGKKFTVAQAGLLIADETRIRAVLGCD